MKKNKKQGEPEIVTLKELAERHKDIKKEELFKLVLKCVNCGHRDLLGNFVKKKGGGNLRPLEPYKPKPYKPEPNPYDNWKSRPPKPLRPSKWYTQKAKLKNTMMLMIDHEKYEDFFFCKKCGSSLIILDEEFVKNNITRVLK